MALSRESKALRESYEVFTSSADPEQVIKKLYSKLLLTPEEKGRAMQMTLTTHQKLDAIFDCLERRVSADPSVFHQLVQVLLEEPAMERAGNKIQACYKESQNVQSASSEGEGLPFPPTEKCVQLALAPSTSTSQLTPAQSTSSMQAVLENSLSPASLLLEHRPEALQIQGLLKPQATTATLLDPDRIEKVAHKALELQDQFVQMLTHTEIAFSERPAGFLSRLQITLITLPLSKKFKRLYYLERRKQEIKNAKSVDEVFEILRHHWNYVDYALLQRLVQEFGESTLQNEMAEYVAALEKFEKETTIQDFKHAKQSDRDAPYDFSKAVLQLNKDPSECTLYDVRQLVESLAIDACLDQYVMFVSGYSCSSVIIKIAFPRAVLELIVGAVNQRFLEKHRIVTMTIDEKPLEEYSQEYVKGLQLLRVSEEGDEASVISLLQSGVNPGFIHTNGENALHFASFAGHTAIVKLILENKAEVDKKSSQRTALHMASEKGHNETVQLLLERGADPNTIDGDGRTAIMMAAKEGHTNTVETLIGAGADITALDWLQQQTALHLASENGHNEIVQLLLKRGADPNRLDGWDRTAVMMAAEGGHTSTVEALMKGGSDVNIQDVEGWTAIMRAARGGHSHTIEVMVKGGAELNVHEIQGLQLLNASERGDDTTVTSLLKSGANPNFSDNYGVTPLHRASYEGHTAVVKVLLDNDADADTAGEGLQQNALHLASEAGHSEIVQILLERGANPNVVDELQQTALHMASLNGRNKTVELLLEKEADPNSLNEDQCTALHIASENGYSKIVQLLLERGADPNISNGDQQQTALHVASENGHNETVQLLLQNGADPNRLNVLGWTALMGAARRGHTHIVENLIDGGANINVCDKEGWTAVMIAAREGHTHTMEVLVQHNIQFMRGLQLLGASTNGEKASVILLLQSGMSPNFSHEDGKTALHCASQAGQTALVKLLLDHGANMHAKSKFFQETALHMASENGHSKTVQLLLERGADPNTLNVLERSALVMAARKGHTHTVEVLVSGNADPNTQDRDGLTALMLATHRGDSGTVSVLVQCGTNLNVQNKEGMTALMIAAKEGQNAIVNILVEGLADVNIQENSIGWTAMFFAAKEGHLNITKKLAGAGADILLMDRNGVTALDVAKVHHQKEVCEVLSKLTLSSRGIPPASSEDRTADLSEKIKLQISSETTPPTLQATFTEIKFSDTSPTEPQSTTKEHIYSPTEYRRRASETRNPVYISVKIIAEMYRKVERKLKSTDEKEKEQFQKKMASISAEQN